MSILQKALQIAGKKDVQIDSRLGNGYLLRLCWKYGWMMLRGKLFGCGNATISNSVFVGKKVRVIDKKSLVIGEKTKIHDFVRMDARSQDGLTIGSHCVIGSKTVMECTGGISYLGKGIKIGDGTTFGNDCYFGAAGGIIIGDDVMAGQYVRFHSENHLFDDLDVLIKDQGVSHQGIKIGNNCWIGAGAVFLDGAELGDGCVVAANAVVTKKFPKNAVIGGVPAKIIRLRGESASE